MEKLETILRAEEASRRALQAARAHAQDLLQEARAQAELIVIDSDRKATEASEGIRSRRLAQAQADARFIDAGSKGDVNAIVQLAESRFEHAVDAVIKEMAGGI